MAAKNWGAVWLTWGCGVFSGLALFVWTHQFLASFGTSVAVTSAMAVSIGLACAGGLKLRSAFTETPADRWLIPGAWFLIAAWTAILPWLLSCGLAVLGWLPMNALSSEATTFSIMLLLTTGLLAIPVCGVVFVSVAPDQKVGRRPRVKSSLLIAAGCGLFAGPLCLAPMVGLAPLAVVVAAVAAALFWWSLARTAQSPQVSTRAQGQTAISDNVRWVGGISFLIGLMVPLLARLALRIMPGNAFEHDAVWASLVGGVGLGMLWYAWNRRRQQTRPTDDGPLAAAAIATIWPVLTLTGWGLLVDMALTVNANVSFVPGVMLIRVAIVAVTVGPVGIALGRLWGTGDDQRILAVGTLAVVAGIVVMQSVTLPTATVMSVLVLFALIVAVARYWALKLPTLVRREKIAGIVVVTAVAMLPLVSGNYRPDLAARLLFSTQTFSALQTGISRDLLPHLDDGRMIQLEESRTATWTAWKHRGSQIALRENGIPRGIVSVRPQSCPQFAGEVLPAVLPLVLHERPQTVLLVGAGSTTTLTSILACPVQSVTCVEGDAGLIRLIDGTIAPAIGHNPLDDDRVELVQADPTLALLASDDCYDVIILTAAQPSVMSAMGGFTTESYAAARRCLKADGILCQRLQYADFGREPIEDLLATVRSAFPQAVLFDAAPGEMLIIATTKAGPLVNRETIDRCEADHIRNLMAQSGWDWSVLMNLGAISPEGVNELIASRGTPNTISNGRFAFRLPSEVMRWSPAELPKWQDRQHMLSASATRMLTWIGETDRDRDIQDRLNDVIEQQRLIVEHPDQFWVYRKTVRKRLQERPRDVIQQVKHEGLKRVLHPEDQRRKDYLKVLAASATVESPEAADIRALADFAVPYDPLVSHFLHQEAARLYERSADADPAARLHHLQYSIYFGPPRDRSVRNVIAALDLLNDHPDVITDPSDRWDEMNALLEVLKQRSSLRLQLDTTASSFELIDAERSIAITRRTMGTMDALVSEVGIPSGDWQNRRTVLERMLVRPMRTYHRQQAERLARLKAQTKLATARKEAESETR